MSREETPGDISNVEVWRAIPGYEGYEVSDHGNVRSLDRYVSRPNNGRSLRRGVALSPQIDRKGYVWVRLSRQLQSRPVRVHRLVLLAFVGPCPPDMEACHDDGVNANNRLDNLRWDTKLANAQDRRRHGQYERGRYCPRGHEYTPDNTAIYGDPPHRYCKTCQRAKRALRTVREREARQTARAGAAT